MTSVVTKPSTKEYIISNNSPLIKYDLDEETKTVTIKVMPNASGSMVVYNTKDHDIDFTMQIELMQNAVFKLYNITTTDHNVNIKVLCDLKEKNSLFENLSVSLSGASSNYNSYTNINHLAPNTTSELSVYAIAKEKANVKLDNNAFIKNGCSKAVAHQKAKGLTLDKTSSIKALPNLFIDEYDVIANHAASIGSLNPEDLFYLMSRGLNKEEASKIIIMGFITPLVEKISDNETKQMILNKFLEKAI